MSMANKGIIDWSLGEEALGGNLGKREACEVAKKAGFDAVELTMGVGEGAKDIAIIVNGTDVEKRVNVEGIRAAMIDTGMAANCLSTGAYWGFPISSRDYTTHLAGINIAKAQIEIAQELGLQYILLVPGAARVTFDDSVPQVLYTDVWKRATDAIGQELEPLARKSGVVICVENVGNEFLFSPYEMAGFIDQFMSPHVKVYFDPANVVFNTTDPKLDPVVWATTLGDRIARVHLKDFYWAAGTREIAGLGCNIGEGTVDLASTISALKAIGYKGDYTAEIMLFGQPKLWTPEVPVVASKAMNQLLGGKYQEEQRYQPQE
jgi:sugar phosphate isomerase/epimerase